MLTFLIYKFQPKGYQGVFPKMLFKTDFLMFYSAIPDDENPKQFSKKIILFFDIPA